MRGKEGKIQREIADAINGTGLGRCWVATSGLLKSPDGKRFVRALPEGFPDLFGWAARCSLSRSRRHREGSLSRRLILCGRMYRRRCFMASREMWMTPSGFSDMSKESCCS